MHNPRGWTRVETIILLIVIALIALAIFTPHSMMRNINLGMTEAELTKAMGRAPDKREKEFSFCKAGAVWYGNCNAIKDTHPSMHLVWRVGIDTWIVVAMDETGKVVYREQADN